MKRFSMLVTVALAIVLLPWATAETAEPDPGRLEAEARELNHEAEVLASRGQEAEAREHAEKAEDLFRQAREMAEHRRRDERDRDERQRDERERGEGERVERRQAEHQRNERADDHERARREIIEQMEALKREVHQLREADRPDAAEQVERELHGLTERLRQLDRERRPPHRDRQPPPEEAIRGRLVELEERMVDLRNHGRHEEAERVEREIHELAQESERRGRHEGRRPQPGPEERIDLLRQAVDHLHQAAERLHMAGFPETAEPLRQQAEKIEAEVGRQTHGLKAHHTIMELREEIGRLRHDFDALRRHVEHAERGRND